MDDFSNLEKHESELGAFFGDLAFEEDSRR